MPLFTRLPDTLFSPLAGPNRHVFVAILTRLYDVFYGTASVGALPTDRSVRGEIEEVLANHALRDWVPEADDGAPPDLPVNSAGNAWRAYRRLVQSGWLEEENEGYTVRAAMPPDIGRMLALLIDLGSQRSRLYGGMVQSIYNNIRQVLVDPEGQAAALSEAARLAQEFALHLRSIAYGLRELGASLREISDPRQLLGSFFSDFVERYLVADYKTLHAQENPFRYRAEILRIVRELRAAPAAHSILPQAYQRLRIALMPGDALLRVDADLMRLQLVFEEIDTHLARIDNFRTLMERRVAESVRYLDKTQPGAAARIAQLVNKLARLDEDKLADLRRRAHKPLAGHGMMAATPLSARSARPPLAARRPPVPQKLRIRVPDPGHMEALRQVRAYLNQRRLDLRRMEVYLENSLGTRQQLTASQLRISSVEDLIVFAHLRHFAHLTHTGLTGQDGDAEIIRRLARHYEVRLHDGMIENEWLRCRDFTVLRRS